MTPETPMQIAQAAPGPTTAVVTNVDFSQRAQRGPRCKKWRGCAW